MVIFNNKTVTFGHTHTKFLYTNKLDNYVKGRRHTKKRNRLLRYIERYMRRHNLLTNDEMLQFSNRGKPHIRSGIINRIAKDRLWIPGNKKLIIVT